MISFKAEDIAGIPHWTWISLSILSQTCKYWVAPDDKGYIQKRMKEDKKKRSQTATHTHTLLFWLSNMWHNVLFKFNLSLVVCDTLITKERLRLYTTTRNIFQYIVFFLFSAACCCGCIRSHSSLTRSLFLSCFYYLQVKVKFLQYKKKCGICH